MNTAIIDIESLPNETLIDQLPEILPPKKMTKAETIEKWYINSYPAVKEKQIRDMSLDPNWGYVCCICGLGNTVFEGVAWEPKDEKKLLKSFWNWIGEKPPFPKLATFNGKSFDVPFLYRRSWFNNVKPPVFYDTLPYTSQNHCDLRLILSHGDKKARGTQAFYCGRKFGTKTEEDGSAVYGWFKNGERDKIVDKCRTDILGLQALLDSMQGFYPL